MTDNDTPLGSLLKKAEDYSKSTIELLSLKAADKSAEFISFLVSRIVFFSILAFSLILLNVGAAIWIGKQLNDTGYGFLITGGFYFLLAMVIQIFRRSIISSPVRRSVVKWMKKQKLI